MEMYYFEPLCARSFYKTESGLVGLSGCRSLLLIRPTYLNFQDSKMGSSFLIEAIASSEKKKQTNKKDKPLWMNEQPEG